MSTTMNHPHVFLVLFTILAKVRNCLFSVCYAKFSKSEQKMMNMAFIKLTLLLE